MSLIPDVDYGDSNLNFDEIKPKKKTPALLRPRTVVKEPPAMLKVPPLDIDSIENFRAAVTIQKLIKGRAMQKMVPAGNHNVVKLIMIDLSCLDSNRHETAAKSGRRSSRKCGTD